MQGSSLLPLVFVAAFTPAAAQDRTDLRETAERLTYSDLDVRDYGTPEGRRQLRQIYNALISQLRADGINPNLSYREMGVRARAAAAGGRAAELEFMEEDAAGYCGYHFTGARNLFKMAKTLGMPEGVKLWGRHVADAYLNGHTCEDSVRFNPEEAYRIFTEIGNQSGAKGAAKAVANRHLMIYLQGDAGSFYENWGSGKPKQPQDMRLARTWLRRAGLAPSEIDEYIERVSKECAPGGCLAGSF